MDISMEDIRSELEKLGYSGIPDEQLTLFKKDLDHLIGEDLRNSGSTLFHSFEDDSHIQPSPIIFANNGGKQEDSGSNVRESARGRVIKRKTLRYLNGKAYVSEESLNTSVTYLNDYPSSVSPEQRKTDTSESCSLLAESEVPKIKTKLGFKGQSRFPIMGYGTKPCDPVLRYHQYKQYWDAYKPPGENSHKELRWFIREQMLDYDPIVDISLQNVPNIRKRQNPPRCNANLPL